MILTLSCLYPQLKKKQLESVQAAITTFVGKNKKVEVKTQVNPAILSGLQVMIGDKFLDLSVSSRITDISKTLEGTI